MSKTQTKILEAIDIARKSALVIEYSSLDQGEDYDIHPYVELETDLLQALEKVRALKNHNHVFGDNGYCDMCGLVVPLKKVI